MFSELETTPSSGRQQTGRHLIADPSLRAVASLETDGRSFTRWLARGGTAVFAPSGTGSGVTAVDLASGQTRLLPAPPEQVNGKFPWQAYVEPESDATFRGRYVYYEGRPGSGPQTGAPSYVHQRFTWAGELVRQWTAPQWASALSPAGDFLVREERLHSKPAVGEGSGEHWPAVVVSGMDSRDLLRVRSASVWYGDRLPEQRGWRTARASWP